MLRPDGSPAPGSPFNPGSIWGAWAVSIDGNDHAWVSNFAPGGGITELCGARTETCPPGMKTGDPISPPGGYKGGGMQMFVDASIDPAGNVWVSNNWQDPNSCYGKPDEGLSTRCGGQGMVVFYGMAKPVRSRRSVQRAGSRAGGYDYLYATQQFCVNTGCRGHPCRPPRR